MNQILNYKEGDTLKVLRKGNKDKDWGDRWVDGMDQYVGMFGKVTDGSSQSFSKHKVHLRFDDNNAYWFPKDCLSNENYLKLLIKEYKKLIKK